MPQVRAAMCAHNFRPDHSQTRIGCCSYSSFFQDIIKTWPARAAVEFCTAAKQGSAAGNADICAWLVVVGIFAAERRFGTFQETDSVLFRRERSFRERFVFWCHGLPENNNEECDDDGDGKEIRKSRNDNKSEFSQRPRG